MAIVQFRVDDELKKQASEVYEKLGLDLSSALRMFLKRCVMVNGIPFPMVLEESQANSYGIEARTDMPENWDKYFDNDLTEEDIAREIELYRAAIK